jgi:16S rRNA processing protein RimM
VPQPGPPRILLGRIADAHGIGGEVLIHSYATVPEDIGAYGTLSDETGGRLFEIESTRATAKGVVARLRGVSDRSGAEALKGAELYIDRDKLPAAADDEFYHADLIGLDAVDPTGKPLGAIVAVHNFGAGDLLEIRLAGTGRTEFVPFTDTAIPSIDMGARRVTVVLPPTADDKEGGDEEE